jgi:hypothetical protein
VNFKKCLFPLFFSILCLCFVKENYWIEMNIVGINSIIEPKSFENYSDDCFFDTALSEFICEIKSIAVKNEDPYFPQMFMDRWRVELQEFMERRGPLKWEQQGYISSILRRISFRIDSTLLANPVLSPSSISICIR